MVLLTMLASIIIKYFYIRKNIQDFSALSILTKKIAGFIITIPYMGMV